MPAGIYYYIDREYYLNIPRDYYNNNGEYLLKKQGINVITHKNTKLKK